MSIYCASHLQYTVSHSLSLIVSRLSLMRLYFYVKFSCHLCQSIYRSLTCREVFFPQSKLKSAYLKGLGHEMELKYFDGISFRFQDALQNNSAKLHLLRYCMVWCCTLQLIGIKQNNIPQIVRFFIRFGKRRPKLSCNLSWISSYLY